MARRIAAPQTLTVWRRYAWYVLRHKSFVFLEACRLGVPLRGLLHDSSELLPDEFVPYAAYFHGGYPRNAKPPAVQAAFDRAWLRHQKRNDHHHQFWLLQQDDGEVKALEMPERCVREMIADWRGAGKAITGADTTIDWYRRNNDKMRLHQNTRCLVEALLGYEG